MNKSELSLIDLEKKGFFLRLYLENTKEGILATYFHNTLKVTPEYCNFFFSGQIQKNSVLQ